MAAMDDVPREILQAAYERKPIYLLKIPLHFAMWIGATLLLIAVQGKWFFVPLGILVSILATNLMRGLGAIAHDAVHGTVFKSKTASYWLGLLCWAPTGMAYTIYSNYHMHHHRITNTYPDVDNFVVTDYTKNPFLAKLIVLAVYSFAYPIYFLFQMFRYTKRLTAWKKVRMGRSPSCIQSSSLRMTCLPNTSIPTSWRVSWLFCHVSAGRGRSRCGLRSPPVHQVKSRPRLPRIVSAPH